MIIGITGKDKNGNVNGVGKSTTAMLICLLGNTNFSTKHCNPTDLEEWYRLFESKKSSLPQSQMWKIVQFSDTLKKIASNWTSQGDLNLQEVKSAPSNILGLSNRQILEILGDGLRNGSMLGPDVWVNSALREYNPERSNWVIPDVRYPNEVAAIEKLGGIVFCVSNDTVTSPKSSHPSNTSLRKIMNEFTVIKNSGSIHDLSLQIQSTLAFHNIDLKPWKQMRSQIAKEFEQGLSYISKKFVAGFWFTMHRTETGYVTLKSDPWTENYKPRYRILYGGQLFDNETKVSVQCTNYQHPVKTVEIDDVVFPLSFQYPEESK